MNEENTRPIRILLADDGSAHARAAVDLICDLPLPADSHITILGVLIPRESSNHAVLEIVLEQTETIFSNKGIDADTELLLGYPQEIILNYAEKNEPDLIVMGAKGLRATLGILLGGVAQSVVEYACCPVLVVRRPYPGIRNIALVTDGSQASEKAVDYLTGATRSKDEKTCNNLPLPPYANLSIIHVLPPIPSPELIARSWPLGPEILPTYTPDHEAEEKWEAEKKPQGEEIIRNTVDALKSCGLDAADVLLQGDAATEIIKYVKEMEIDLIVAGSRGLSQIRGLLLGSVSRKLLHYADCSVLVVK